jgi:PBP1b-binding outer membrane lipoprotein LpoB
MIHIMKKLLIPLFSLLIALFLSSCAHEPTSTTTSTTTRETTVQQPTSATQTTTTRY